MTTSSNWMRTTRPTGADAGGWVADPLPNFEQLTCVLSDVAPARGEASRDIVATLVRPRQQHDGKTAVVYVPGFNDYFFHTHVAEFFTAQGFGFYAVDPRRSGRSWRPGQYRSYIEDIDDYAVELDLACAQARDDGFARIVLYGHSTGGLAVSLYADRPHPDVAAVILNSPFLALPGPQSLRHISPGVRRIAARTPERIVPGWDLGFYGQALHASFGGEWDYDLTMKPHPADRLRFGWCSAVVNAQALVARGLNVTAPVLCLTAARSSLRRTWDDDCRRVDIVLDQKRCGAAATRLGRDVSVVRILDGVHDLALSGPQARDRFFAAIARWLPYAGLT